MLGGDWGRWEDEWRDEWWDEWRRVIARNEAIFPHEMLSVVQRLLPRTSSQ